MPMSFDKVGLVVSIMPVPLVKDDVATDADGSVEILLVSVMDQSPFVSARCGTVGH